MKEISAFQQRFLGTLPPKASEVLSAVSFPNLLEAIYVGHKLVQGNSKNENGHPLLVIFPRLDLANVVHASTGKYPSFEEYLKEAIRPAEYSLSNKDQLETFNALRELSNRPYFCRAWIVQEIMSSSRSTIVCGKH